MAVARPTSRQQSATNVWRRATSSCSSPRRTCSTICAAPTGPPPKSATTNNSSAFAARNCSSLTTSAPRTPAPGPARSSTSCSITATAGACPPSSPPTSTSTALRAASAAACSTRRSSATPAFPRRTIARETGLRQQQLTKPEPLPRHESSTTSTSSQVQTPALTSTRILKMCTPGRARDMPKLRPMAGWRCWGITAAGKTHLAAAIANHRIDRGFKVVLSATVPDHDGLATSCPSTAARR